MTKKSILYPTALPISQTLTLGQVITQKIQSNASNSDVLIQRAELKLKEIANGPNVEYILDRLDDEDLKYLVNSWSGILKELKEKFNTSRLDKDNFISLIKSHAQDVTMNTATFTDKKSIKRRTN